jgi:hypothetical protein
MHEAASQIEAPFHASRERRHGPGPPFGEAGKLQQRFDSSRELVPLQPVHLPEESEILDSCQ